jgi:hypothetical protein
MSASLALALSAGTAAAQSLPPPYDSYAVKVSCGRTTVDADVVVGIYATSVNIHNPQSQLAVQFNKKFVVALQEGVTPPGKVFSLNPSSGALEVLQPDLAERVDCPLIVKVAAASGVTLPAHFEGFVVIQVPPQPAATAPNFPPLDVVAKYTARGGATGFTVVKYPATHITM